MVMILSEHTWESLLDPTQTVTHIRQYAHWVKHQPDTPDHVYYTLHKLNEMSREEQLNWYPIWDRIYHIPQQYHILRWSRGNQHTKRGWLITDTKNRKPKISSRR